MEQKSELAWAVGKSNRDSGYYTIPYFKFQSTLDGYRGPKDVTAIHPCSHIKVTQSPGPYFQIGPYNPYDPGAGIEWGEYPGNIPSNLEGESVLSDSIMDTIMFDMAGMIPQDINLWNFVIELPQSLTLWNNLYKPLRNARSWKQLRHGMADTHLAYSFGLLPLISDLRTLAAMPERINDRLDKLSRVPKTWSRFSNQLQLPTTPVGESFSGWQNKSKGESCITFLKYGGFRKSAQTIPDRGDVWTDALGLKNLPGALWEGIPFSFVLDWFLPIGDVIDSWQSKSSAAALLYERSWHSIKKVSITNIYRKERYSASFSHVNTCVHKRYTRNVGLPSPARADLGSRFGLKQALLGGSLAMQRIK